MSAKKPIYIDNWATHYAGEADPFMPPEHLTLVVSGQVFDREGFGYGEQVMTSAIVGVEGRIVTTISGSVYKLGRPAKAFLDWLKSEGRNYDKKQPIKLTK